ncbi:MAG: metallophosphoesterase [Thermoanaerobaculia bacterium]|nr:metallophosphoesterase [Thermoanaerobaculia bacterium]
MLRHWMAAALLLASASESTAEPRGQTSPRRVVAIGDIHGAIEPLRRILRETRLMDSSGRWTGGDAMLVQTGDFLDRGAGVFEVVELLRSLQQQAPRDGGEVVVLMGNHEAINLIRDMSYVDAALLEPWASRRADRLRRRHCDKALDLAQRRRALQDLDAPDPQRFRESCLAETPPGLLEYLESLEADADLGSWLRTLPAVVKVGDLLFVHGGLTEATAALDPEEINAQAAREVAAFDRIRGWLISRSIVLPTAAPTEITNAALQVLDALESGTKIFEAPALEDLAEFRRVGEWILADPDGPLWFRGYARWDDQEGAPRVEAILRLSNANAIISGHTPQKTANITERWDGRVYLIDTGMLGPYYGGQPSALEVIGRQVTAIYPDLRHIFRGAVN